MYAVFAVSFSRANQLIPFHVFQFSGVMHAFWLCKFMSWFSQPCSCMQKQEYIKIFFTCTVSVHLTSVGTLDLCRYTSPGRTLIGINGLLMTYTRRCAVTWAFYTYKLLRSMWCDALVKAIVMNKLYRQRFGCGVPGQVLPTTSHKPMYVHTTHANGSLTYWLLWQGLFSLRNSFQILQ